MSERILIEMLEKAHAEVPREHAVDRIRIGGIIDRVKAGPEKPGTLVGMTTLAENLDPGTLDGRIAHIAEWAALVWAVECGSKTDTVVQWQLGTGRRARPESMTHADYLAEMDAYLPWYLKAKTKTARTEEPS